MAATLMVLDAASLFIGDEDPTAAEYLTLKNVKIPALKEKTKEHTGGGATMSINIGMRVLEALEFSFKLEGFSHNAMSRFMPSGPARVNYTLRGSYRDLRTHEELALRAIINGRMISIEPSEFSRGEGIENDYMISEIMGYQLFLDDREKYYFDYFAGPTGVRIDGVQPFRTMGRNLGLI
ncbi:MAG: hypothetical protein EA385_14990 [Salinarimonadaceae bacterium]|nr:MAG: hypothetical protein EA385_14990 [Salinarimonadaceae bacterium]